MQRIGRYEILEEIGRGGFGRVYRANDPFMKCEVAIKVMSNADDPEMLARFQDEAAAARKLRHESIVTIYDIGQENGVPYIVMEYLQGSDLQRMREKNIHLSLVEKLRILSQVAAGLQVAHENGIYHRDVKPANIMILKDGSVKIMDFGIARLVREDVTRRTRTGMVVGTLQYIPPEQFDEHPVDNLADLWAYGVIAYQMFSGRNPFDAADTVQVIYNITSLPIPDLQKLNPELPEDLCQIVRKLLQRDRTKRYQTFEDLRFDLNPVLEMLEGQEASRLVDDARVSAARGDLQSANQILRQVLDRHPSNTQAKQIRDQVITQIRATEAGRQLEELLNKGDTAFVAGSFEEALSAFKQACTLSPASSTAKLRMDRAQQMVDRMRRTKEELNTARARLAAGAARDAQVIIAGILADNPDHADAIALMADAEREATRQADSQRADAILYARHLISQSRYPEAMEAVDNCARMLGDHPDLERVRGEVRSRASAGAAQTRIETGLAQANDCIKAGAFAEATRILTALAAEFPQNGDVKGLLKFANEEEARMRRRVTEQVKAVPPTPAPPAPAPVTPAKPAGPDRNSVIVRALQLAGEKERAAQTDEAVHILEVALSRFPDAEDLVKERQRLLAPKAPRIEWAPGLEPSPVSSAKPAAPILPPRPPALAPPSPPSRKGLWIGLAAVVVAAAGVGVWQPWKSDPIEEKKSKIERTTNVPEVKTEATKQVLDTGKTQVSTLDTGKVEPPPKKKQDTESVVVPPPKKKVAGPSLQSQITGRVRFAYKKGTSIPGAQAITLDRPVTATVSSNGTWLVAAPSGPHGVSLSLMADRVSSMIAGVYSTAVRLTAADDQAELPVELTIDGADPPPPPPKKNDVKDTKQKVTGPYNGPKRGDGTWTGTLASGAKLVLGETGVLEGGGRYEGDDIPTAIDITVTATPGSLLVHAGGAGDSRRVEITNNTGSPVRNVKISWSKK